MSTKCMFSPPSVSLEILPVRIPETNEQPRCVYKDGRRIQWGTFESPTKTETLKRCLAISQTKRQL